MASKVVYTCDDCGKVSETQTDWIDLWFSPQRFRGSRQTNIGRLHACTKQCAHNIITTMVDDHA